MSGDVHVRFRERLGVRSPRATRPVLVSDSAIVEAVAQLLKQEKLVVEPSGAASFAAARSGEVAVSGPTVCVLSGGNISSDLLRSL